MNLFHFAQYASVCNSNVFQNTSGFVLSSTGQCSEYQGSKLGIYDVFVDDSNPDKRVYKQKGGEYYLYKETGKWYVGKEIGGLAYYWTNNLFNTGAEWYCRYKSKWNNEDTTMKFIPLTSDSCLLSSSLNVSSFGPAASSVPDYLGIFHPIQNKFSAGRPVWRNKHGKVLMIEPKYSAFGVYDDLT